MITYKNLLTLRAFNDLIGKSAENGADVMPVYHLSRLVKKLSSFFEEYEEAVEDLRLDHCYKENNKIIRDESGRLQWTAEGEKAFRKATKELLAQEVSIPQFTPLSYADLCAVMPEGFAKANPWEVMAEALAPFYINGSNLDE
jgi:hypothetical protein